MGVKQRQGPDGRMYLVSPYEQVIEQIKKDLGLPYDPDAVDEREEK